MVDASSRIPSGISKGNFYAMGNYDICLDIQTVETQFCHVPLELSITLPEAHVARMHMNGLAQKTSSPLDAIGIYICVFKSCNEQDLNIMFKGLLTFQQQNCLSKNSQPQLDNLAIIAM